MVGNHHFHPIKNGWLFGVPGRSGIRIFHGPYGTTNSMVGQPTPWWDNQLHGGTCQCLTLPETNSSPLKMGAPWNLGDSGLGNHYFAGAMLAYRRVSTTIQTGRPVEMFWKKLTDLDVLYLFYSIHMLIFGSCPNTVTVDNEGSFLGPLVKEWWLSSHCFTSSNHSDVFKCYFLVRY